MSWKKDVLKHKATLYIAGWLIATYVRLVYATSRKVLLIDDHSKIYMNGSDNAIFAFWHGRMMMMPTFEPPKRKMHVLISQHRDGGLSSNVTSRFGEVTIRGGSSKGGMAAATTMLRALRAGDNVTITPDGPRGPPHVASAGIVAIARLSQKPVLPVAVSSTRFKRLSSWDSFMVALPFGKLVFCVGEPIMVHREANDAAAEQARIIIEQAINVQTQKADKLTHA